MCVCSIVHSHTQQREEIDPNLLHKHIWDFCFVNIYGFQCNIFLLLGMKPSFSLYEPCPFLLTAISLSLALRWVSNVFALVRSFTNCDNVNTISFSLMLLLLIFFAVSLTISTCVALCVRLVLTHSPSHALLFYFGFCRRSTRVRLFYFLCVTKIEMTAHYCFIIFHRGFDIWVFHVIRRRQRSDKKIYVYRGTNEMWQQRKKTDINRAHRRPTKTTNKFCRFLSMW